MSEDDDADSLRELVESYLKEAGQRIVEFTEEEDLPDTFEDAVEVADEAEDVTNHVDVSDIVDAIDWSELPAAVDQESASEAIASGDAGDAIHFRELIEAIDFGELADSVDMRRTWKEGRELNDAVDDLTDDDASDGDASDGAKEPSADVDVDAGAFGDADPEAVRAGILSEMLDAVDEFRAGLLEVHEELEAIVEENRKASEQRRAEQPDSRNPTAVSTMPGMGPLGGRIRQGSTVPKETRYSNAPNRERLYGKRLEEDPDD